MQDSREEELVGKPYDPRVVRRLMRYLRPDRGGVVLTLLTFIGSEMLHLLPPQVVRWAIAATFCRGEARTGGNAPVGASNA